MLTETHSSPCGCGGGDGCAGVGVFSRLRYFHGQPLGALDLRREQAYFVDKARLRNRLLHGWGIVCGLDVEVSAKGTELVVQPGAAIDCPGNELVVRRPRAVSLSSLLGADDLERLHKKPGTVYLTLCYREVPADPSRPLLAGGCEPASTCEYGRIVETFQLCASVTPPDPGPACEPCCGACGDPCLRLAAVTAYDPATPICPDQLDLGGRRRLARHAFPQITEVNWVHGATYRPNEANGLLDAGLEVWLSRPVQVASLRPGVVDLTWLDLGGGRRGGVYSIEGEFAGLPATGLVDHFVYRRTTGETLQRGDRVTVTVHGDFILDECCRALDGDHLGGGVPARAAPKYPPLTTPAAICEPRPSGDGVEGGDFLSWIYVAEKD